MKSYNYTMKDREERFWFHRRTWRNCCCSWISYYYTMNSLWKTYRWDFQTRNIWLTIEWLYIKKWKNWWKIFIWIFSVAIPSKFWHTPDKSCLLPWSRREESYLAIWPRMGMVGLDMFQFLAWPGHGCAEVSKMFNSITENVEIVNNSKFQ